MIHYNRVNRNLYRVVWYLSIQINSLIYLCYNSTCLKAISTRYVRTAYFEHGKGIRYIRLQQLKILPISVHLFKTKSIICSRYLENYVFIFTTHVRSVQWCENWWTIGVIFVATTSWNDTKEKLDVINEQVIDGILH